MNLLDDLAPTPTLVRATTGDGSELCLWRDGILLALRSPAAVTSLDALLGLPADDMRAVLDLADGVAIGATATALLAPVEGQEVWAAGVTYRRSRDARVEESEVADVYERVYSAERPELFYKSAGWRVVGPGGHINVRADSGWDAPEPELAVLANAYGEIVAYACGNDVSSRSIEGANPLYLPQAKVYDGSCALGPGAVLAPECEPGIIELEIWRGGEPVFRGSVHPSAMVREPVSLVASLFVCYSLPVGAWLLTGTGIVPPDEISLASGDRVAIGIEGVGRLHNAVGSVGR